MELDSTHRPKPRDRAEDDKRKRNNECFNCGRMGHYAARYLNKRVYCAAETMLAEEELREMSGKEGPQE
jgi:hypothetical protein